VRGAYTWALLLILSIAIPIEAYIITVLGGQPAEAASLVHRAARHADTKPILGRGIGGGDQR
jgi:hypothetical protein